MDVFIENEHSRTIAAKMERKIQIKQSKTKMR